MEKLKTAFEQLENVNSAAGLSGITIAVGFLVGMLYCFLGYRLHRFTIALTGFILAGFFSAILAGLISSENLTAILISAIMGGLTGAFALLFAYKVGIFVIGVLGGGLACTVFLAEVAPEWHPWIYICLGLLGGIFALFIERPSVIIATSVIGASIILRCLLIALSKVDIQYSNHTLTVAIAWSVLVLMGTVMQFRSFKKKKSLKP